MDDILIHLRANAPYSWVLNEGVVSDDMVYEYKDYFYVVRMERASAWHDRVKSIKKYTWDGIPNSIREVIEGV